MATPVLLKRETLKSIGNVPNWVLQQRTKDKKDAKAIRPHSNTSSKCKATTTPVAQVAPYVADPQPAVPQPVKEEVNAVVENGAQEPPAMKVRRIYSREFLIKFKYSASPFPPGTITPSELMAQYNKVFEARERSVTQQDTSSVGKPSQAIPTTNTTNPSNLTNPTQQQQQQQPHKNDDEVDGVLKETRRGTSTEKRAKGIDGGKREKAFKLRLPTGTDESILNSPMFRGSANSGSKVPKRAAQPSPFAQGENKENASMAVAGVKRSAPIAKLRPSTASKKDATKPPKAPVKVVEPTPTTAPVPVLVSPATVLAPATAPALATAPAPATTPVPAPVPTTPALIQASPIVAPPHAPQPTDATVEMNNDDSKQDTVVDALTKKLKSVLKETDARRLAQRQKQIEYGKATAGYQDYVKIVAKNKRKREDPKTPNKYQVCSKRSWDGQIRKWRRMLHSYDPADAKANGNWDRADADADADADAYAYAYADADAGGCGAGEVSEADVLAEENALRE